MTFDELKDKARSLPLQPGVYIMMDAGGKVIYVGKAKALRNRVSQYFQDSAAHTEKTRAMVSHIDHFDTIIADSEFEALVLECSLIKRHQPYYNILLKDDKGYPYIRLSTDQLYPRFSLAGRMAEDGARYFGPYASRSATHQIIDAICAALRLPTCRRQFPRDVGKDRPCLNHHMGTCDAWCRPEMTAAAYRERINLAVRLLEGKLTEVEADLQKEMEAAAEELRFEQAAALRDQMKAIRLLGTQQKVVAGALADTDVTGFYRGEVKSCFAVLHFADGALAARDTRILDTPMEADSGEVFSSLLKHYYLARGSLPRRILLPCELEDEVPLARLLSQNAGRWVELVTPKRGAKADLIRMADKNAREEVERLTTREERQNRTLVMLAALLDLPALPDRIEAYDISNTGKDDIVASMTVFSRGRPLKRDYRRFKIKTLTGPDDYASMDEVLTRRFRHYLEGDQRFGALPDLLLIDGGDRHAAVAEQVLARAGLSIPVFGMVKDDRHRTRALVTADGMEIGIQQNQALFSFIGRIQEETHRFAIEFHRLERGKHSRRSALDDIPGVGPARKAQLLKEFKSVKAIAAATQAQLAQVVSRPAAAAVFAHFHPEDGPAVPPSESKEE